MNGAFDWGRVVAGAQFYHARYTVPGTRQPELCTVSAVRSTKVLRLGQVHTITRVFYVIGSTGDQVWNLPDEFPQVVRAWAGVSSGPDASV